MNNRNAFESCCIIVKNIEREVYVVPTEYKRGMPDETNNMEEEDVAIDVLESLFFIR